MKIKKGINSTSFATTAIAYLLTANGMNAYGWSVSGIVKNSSGTPLSGVAVTVKDSIKYTASTDATGNFKLQSPTAILSSRSAYSSPFSVRLAHGELLVKCPRDGSLELSLVNSLGRSIWTANAISNQGIARVAFPTDLCYGATFLQIRHANGVEYHSVSWGPDGMHIKQSGSSISNNSALTAAASATIYPSLIFKKSDYRDTMFSMTSENMTNVSVVMALANAQVCALPSTLKWQSSAALVGVHPDARHDVVSVKDPTCQKYNGKYLIYCTVFIKSTKAWSMQFIQFDDWSKADSVTPYFMDQTPEFGGYKCAPELFYFEPQKLWYLIWQGGDPFYSTTTTPDDPKTWSTPKAFYPNGVPGNPNRLDYFPIADATNFYLFWTGDDGSVYRAKTTVANFPSGFGTPVKIKSLGTNIIFEGSSHYKIKGTANTYLHVVEGSGSTGRVFSAWTSDGLEGEWKDYKVGAGSPFAGRNNVTYAPGVKDWSDDVSHGELLRENPN
jgi:hypothetical protein